MNAAALKDAGDNWLEINGEPWNKVKQREYAKKKNIQQSPNQVKHQSIPPVNSESTERAVSDDKTLAFSFPIFEQSDFYGIAGDIAKLASKDSEADPIAVYLSFLATASAMLGRNKYIQIGDTRHYSRLFVSLVGASSRARKGTSFKPVKRILRKTEEIYTKRSKETENSHLIVADGGLSSAEGLIYQVRDEAEQTTGKDKVPLWDGVEDKRLLVVEEELANVLKISQREGNTLSPLLRKAWDGGDLAPMTKNNRLKSTNPHINVLAHITQFELKVLMSQSDIHNGLSNRFLWACVRRTKKIAFPKQMDNSKVLNIAIRLSEVFEKSQLEQEVTFTSAAREFWGLEYLQVSIDKTGLIGSVTSRSEAYVMRLSLLFCLLDGQNIIDKQHINAAISMIEFCNKSVEFIFSTPAESEAGTDADKLLKELEKKPMSQTEISRLFSGHKNRRELTSMLTDLQTLNKVKSAKEVGSKKVIWQLINKIPVRN